MAPKGDTWQTLLELRGNKWAPGEVYAELERQGWRTVEGGVSPPVDKNQLKPEPLGRKKSESLGQAAHRASVRTRESLPRTEAVWVGVLYADETTPKHAPEWVNELIQKNKDGKQKSKAKQTTKSGGESVRGSVSEESSKTQ